MPPITKIETNVSLAAPSPVSTLGEKPVDPLEGMVLVTSGIGQLSSNVTPICAIPTISYLGSFSG